MARNGFVIKKMYNLDVRIAALSGKSGLHRRIPHTRIQAIYTRAGQCPARAFICIYIYDFLHQKHVYLHIERVFIMLKKVLAILLACMFFGISGISAFADGENAEKGGVAEEIDNDPFSPKNIPFLDELIRAAEMKTGDKVLKDTDQFLVKITKPEGNVVVFEEKYKVGGASERKDIRVALALFNTSKGCYEYFRNEDGEYYWDIGPSGLFAQEIVLKQNVEKETNRLKFVAYIKSDRDKLEPGVNLQINCFNITFRSESIKDKIINTVRNFTDFLSNLLK